MPKLPRLSLAQIALFLAIIVIGYFGFATIGDTLLSHRVNQDEQQLRQDVAGLQQDEAQLKAIRDYLYTDEYVEGVARRVLGLVRSGESLVIVSPSSTATPVPDVQTADQSPKRWWEKLYIP